ncbi:hypothetical protein PIB30_068109 [Stylosanthes scabra]|uniref:Uncharacterized protein n=1 Tax=Stylosanthes scabra TaxID=79078 RepID=A0ABU6QNS7_9FABA|nr:hypothetical protein [Stylosanthes scabra]
MAFDITVALLPIRHSRSRTRSPPRHHSQSRSRFPPVGDDNTVVRITKEEDRSQIRITAHRYKKRKGRDESLPIDDHTPILNRILRVQLQRHFVKLTDMKYDGSTDPHEHLRDIEHWLICDRVINEVNVGPSSRPSRDRLASGLPHFRQDPSRLSLRDLPSQRESILNDSMRNVRPLTALQTLWQAYTSQTVSQTTTLGSN